MCRRVPRLAILICTAARTADKGGDSADGPAAVDEELAAGGVAGQVGGEVDDRGRDLLRLGDPRYGQPVLAALDERLLGEPVPRQQGRGDGAGWMEFTRMLYWPSSAAAALVRPRTAHLLVT